MPVIWTTHKLEEGKPCNEMELFKHYINIRVEIEHFAALEQPNRREIPKILVPRRGRCHVQRKIRNYI